jgi:hypothetical protein
MPKSMWAAAKRAPETQCACAFALLACTAIGTPQSPSCRHAMRTLLHAHCTCLLLAASFEGCWPRTCTHACVTACGATSTMYCYGVCYLLCCQYETATFCVFALCWFRTNARTACAWSKRLFCATVGNAPPLDQQAAAGGWQAVQLPMSQAMGWRLL